MPEMVVLSVLVMDIIFKLRRVTPGTTGYIRVFTSDPGDLTEKPFCDFQEIVESKMIDFNTFSMTSQFSRIWTMKCPVFMDFKYMKMVC